MFALFFCLLHGSITFFSLAFFLLIRYLLLNFFFHRLTQPSQPECGETLTNEFVALWIILQPRIGFAPSFFAFSSLQRVVSFVNCSPVFWKIFNNFVCVFSKKTSIKLIKAFKEVELHQTIDDFNINSRPWCASAARARWSPTARPLAASPGSLTWRTHPSS